MKYKNSFFKIRIKEDGTYLDVFPPKEDGKRLDIREVVSFLEQKGFAGFSIDALRKTLDLLQEKPLQIKISDTCAKAFDESATIITGKDNMIAYIRFYPPSTGGKLMTEREIRAELEREKILYGILEPVMEKLKTTRTYCTNIPIVLIRSSRWRDPDGATRVSEPSTTSSRIMRPTRDISRIFCC